MDVLCRRCNGFLRELVNPAAEKFFAELTSTSDDSRKHLLIAALQNLYSPKVTELLKPMAYGEVSGVSDNLQKKAIRAALIGTYYTETTKDFLLPIFLNMRNGHESRIQAVEGIMMMMEVDVTTLSTIMTQMYVEPDYEVNIWRFLKY